MAARRVASRFVMSFLRWLFAGRNETLTAVVARLQAFLHGLNGSAG
jgi:hypothetical protein